MSPIDKLLQKADDAHELSNFELRATLQGLASVVREMRAVSSNTMRTMVEQHGNRVNELLAANNADVERRRAAEAKLREAETIIRELCVHEGAERWSVYLNEMLDAYGELTHTRPLTEAEQAPR